MIINKHNTISTACHIHREAIVYNNTAFAWRKIVIYIHMYIYCS